MRARSAADPPRPRAGRWLVLTLYLNALLWSIPFQRLWSEAILRADVGRWWVGGLGIAFGILVIGVALGSGVAARAGRPPRASALLAAAFAYAGLVWYLSPVPDEVVHLAEYGVLGLLFWWALGPVHGSFAPWMAVVATGAVGLVDEWVQYATPGRFFDWRDVFANFASGLLPVWALARPAATRGEREG